MSCSNGSLGVMILVALIIMGFLSSCEAYKFYVGGKDGWVLKPSENYSHWAQRNRFQVNDALFFKYKNGSDSVLIVTKEDYNSCNTKKPIVSITDGNSIFTLDRSGPFFFISGKTEKCQNGQKLIVVVLAVRNKPHFAPLSPSRMAYAPSESPIGAVSPAYSDSPQSDNTGPDSVLNNPPQIPSGNSALLSFSGEISMYVLVISFVLGSFVGMV